MQRGDYLTLEAANAKVRALEAELETAETKIAILASQSEDVEFWRKQTEFLTLMVQSYQAERTVEEDEDYEEDDDDDDDDDGDDSKERMHTS